ncbi:hypothetical protein [Glutamicibacter sp. JC586]|uniref:hypothetical protein n=1 Tax=Glutamicibacter sp. JC586 TaxID=2590552 RepID=UPI0013585881|nr:hypothetical protein [Glutamicibacter sp. JC586]
MQRSLVLCATGILALTVLTGCNASSTDSPSNEPTADNATASSASQSSTEQTQTSQAPVDTSDVIATNEFVVPGHKNDKVKVGIQSLKVEGKTMILQYVLTPDFSSESDSAKISIYDMFGDLPPRTTLVDRENLKEYTVISDVGRSWAADAVHSQTTNHEPIIWWGVYAAPEDNNDSFDVRVIDSMAEFADVPVTR